jgi:hypothetical protein
VDIKPTFVPFNLAVLIVFEWSITCFRSAAERILGLVVDKSPEATALPPERAASVNPIGALRA